MSCRVVVADDDSDIRQLVSIAVAKAGLELVATADDGKAAWDAIREQLPDLAILDVSMPEFTGVEVCRMVRADPTLAAVRVLLLSAAVDDASRAIGLEAGAEAYHSKPFSPRGLAEWLEPYGRSA